MYVTICQLVLHENLFYATREVGRLYETGRYLHNYGLTFALGLVTAPYFNNSAVPRYAEDLATLNEQNIYVLPAKPLTVAFELTTFKYADNRYHVQMEQSSRNTPTFGRAKELAVGSLFEFFILSDQAMNVPKWIRLGKWMSKAAVQIIWQEELKGVQGGSFTSAMPVNPVDLPAETRLLTYDLIAMPPVSLLDHAHLAGPHYRLADGRCVAAGLAYRVMGEKLQ
ncbi:MAG: type I-D CRISPR-associated protein Cas5/Csc1 [Caldilineaceae bacterium]